MRAEELREPIIVESITMEPLNVPLREPFVIASARVDETTAGLVRVRLRQGDRVEEGLGEAATLPPVTAEYSSVLQALTDWVPTAIGLESFQALSYAAWGKGFLCEAPVARAALSTALVDACARLAGVASRTWIATTWKRPLERVSGSPPVIDTLETDITLPISDPSHMVHLAREWRAKGFTKFKVKVGKNFDDDVRALTGVHDAVRDASFRLDANEGFTADQALALLSTIEARGCVVDCFEQPCRRDDLDAMARVTRETHVPIIADESVRSIVDFDAVVKAKAASGVNLKLVKLGTMVPVMDIGTRAKQLGMKVMCGAMVETRLGLVAMANVAAALGGVDFVDLDTAFLLAHDPFEGGWITDGPRIRLTDGPGLDVRLRER